MNFVFVSPNFPTRYFKWVESLRFRGINVLGIGDTPYGDLHPRLVAALNEYYFVPNMADNYAMERAVEYFQNKYGKIDFIESNNEWWLEEDARLREKFGVTTGFHPSDMGHIKAKSKMKEYFKAGGAKTMRYLLIHGKEDKEAALKFIEEVGYPVFVKPDVGVGAGDSYSIKTPEALDEFFEKTLPEPYIMEEFVDGRIVSFDGICNSQGDVVFCCTDHFPVPIDRVVNEGLDHVYYNVPFDLPMIDVNAEEFERVGRAVVKAFGIKRRFFHIEFFVLNQDKPGLGKKDDFVALECNMRAPGGYTPDLIDYGSSVSVYDIYADVIAYDEVRVDLHKKKYYGVASHQKDTLSYRHNEQEIRAKFGDHVKMSGRYPSHIATVMCDFFIFATFETYEEAQEFDRFVRAKR
ncbi:MAG: carbamoylphosphate synthase large subunit [Bacilli bacterium]|nr:carbamoylphosphate synthase large subunit [Bacilli bacterium]MDY6393091.1 carbamoylphosphate synthase large subunit [Bacilli bacterium]